MERNKIDSNYRPSPEAFLAEAKKENRGKLKIFLGASPGVGKTYAMLGDATVLRKEGIDVAVGIVETHGRKDTESMLHGLEIIPRKKIQYRDKEFPEMDIDAILERRPTVVLVDELAHTNIEGSRHPKRYQDVEELLSSGIDVYSTVNIQHIESLNDVVSRIAGIQIKETVPDRILHLADEIELIDIPPKELQKRLQEGKVYVPEQARKAIHNFFTQSNLTALRELALRFTAERVDSQMLQLMQVQGIAESWPTRERIMVCIGDDYEGLELVRTCHQTAARWKAPWLAVHVNTNRQAMLATDADCVTKALQLAEELGGEVITLAGDDIVGQILSFAKSRNVSHIIVGKPPTRKWYKFFSQTFAIELYKRSEFLKVILVPTGDIVVRERKEKKKKRHKLSRIYTGYIAATLACAGTNILVYIISSFINLPNLSMIFLLPILYVAVTYGMWTSLYTVIISMLTYHFFFIEPYFSLLVINKEHAFASFFFLIVAATISRQASLIREQVETVQQNAERTASLYGFSKKIAAASDIDTVFKAVVKQVAEIFDVKVTLLMPLDDMLKVVAGYPHLDELSKGAAMWAWKKNEPAGHSTTTLPASNWFFVPMQTDSGIIGVIGIEFSDKSKVLLSNQKRILDALSHQAAVAIERIQLSETINDAKLYTKTEKLRAALLSSISHDFCEPIALVMEKVWSIKGKNKLDKQEEEETLDIIYKEVSRMNRFIKNLVSMSKGGSDKLELNKDWINPEDIIDIVLQRNKSNFAQRNVIVNIQDKMPKLYVDSILLEQVLTNICNNICDISSVDGTVNLNASYDQNEALIELNYDHKQIGDKECDNILFEFNSDDGLEKNNQSVASLRFAVAKSIIKEHNGQMTIARKTGLNTLTVLIMLPLHEQGSVN